MKSKRNAYDSLFTHLLSDKKYALKAYQALNPDDKTTTEDNIKDITIHNVFVEGLYNDFSMKVNDDEFYFLEAQSYSITNLPYRMGSYFFETTKAEMNRQKISTFSSKPIPLPHPRFYIIYTGDENVPDIINTDDIYYGGKHQDVTIRAHVIKMKDTLNKNIFDEYFYFCKRLKENRKIYGDTIKAIEFTFRDCITNGVLVDYIQLHREEIVDMIDWMYDQERQLEYLRLEHEADAKKELEKQLQQGLEQGIQQGLQQGLQQGIQQGTKQSQLEIAKQMKLKNIPLDLIVECTKLTKEEIEQL